MNKPNNSSDLESELASNLTLFKQQLYLNYMNKNYAIEKLKVSIRF